jgi:hypothetical protein
MTAVSLFLISDVKLVPIRSVSQFSRISPWSSCRFHSCILGSVTEASDQFQTKSAWGCHLKLSAKDNGILPLCNRSDMIHHHMITKWDQSQRADVRSESVSSFLNEMWSALAEFDGLTDSLSPTCVTCNWPVNNWCSFVGPFTLPLALIPRVVPHMRANCRVSARVLRPVPSWISLPSPFVRSDSVVFRMVKPLEVFIKMIRLCPNFFRLVSTENMAFIPPKTDSAFGADLLKAGVRIRRSGHLSCQCPRNLHLNARWSCHQSEILEPCSYSACDTRSLRTDLSRRVAEKEWPHLR